MQLYFANLLTNDKRITKAVFGGMGIGFTNPNWHRRIEFGNVFSGRTEPNEMTTEAVNFAKNLDVNFKIMGYLQDYQPETTIAELNNIEARDFGNLWRRRFRQWKSERIQEQLPNSKLSLVSGDHMSTPFSEDSRNRLLNFLMKNNSGE